MRFSALVEQYTTLGASDAHGYPATAILLADGRIRVHAGGAATSSVIQIWFIKNDTATRSLNASLMNTGSLVGMGDRTEITSLENGLADTNVSEIQSGDTNVGEMPSGDTLDER